MNEPETKLLAKVAKSTALIPILNSSHTQRHARNFAVAG